MVYHLVDCPKCGETYMPSDGHICKKAITQTSAVSGPEAKAPTAEEMKKMIKQFRMPVPEIKFFSSPYLPKGTVCVSEDVYELLKEKKYG